MNRRTPQDFDEQKAEGKERADRFASESTNTYGQCRTLSDTAAVLRNEVLDWFCKEIDVPKTSIMFELARKIGDNASAWESAQLPWGWLEMYLFAIVEEEEFELMMKVAEAAKHGAFTPNMHALVSVMRKRYPKYGVAEDLIE